MLDRILFEVRPFLVALPYFADSCSKPSKENDLIITAATGKIKTRTIRNLIFSLTLLAVSINNQRGPPLGLPKSIYYAVPVIIHYNFTLVGELLYLHLHSAVDAQLIKFELRVIWRAI